MDKIKDFFRTLVEYMKANLTLTIVIAVAVVLCVIIIVFAVSARKAVKKKRAAANKTSDSSIVKPADSTVIDSSDEKISDPENAESEPNEIVADSESDRADAENSDVETEETQEYSDNEDNNKTESENSELAASAIEKKEEKEEKRAKTQPAGNPASEQKKPAPKQPEQKAPVKYAGKWIIIREGDNRYSAELRASNAEILLRTESYSGLSGIKSGIATVKANIENNNYAVNVDKNGNFFFKVFSSAKRLLCISEAYGTRAQCERAFESVKRFSKTAVITTDDGDKAAD